MIISTTSDRGIPMENMREINPSVTRRFRSLGPFNVAVFRKPFEAELLVSAGLAREVRGGLEEAVSTAQRLGRRSITEVLANGDERTVPFANVDLSQLKIDILELLRTPEIQALIRAIANGTPLPAALVELAPDDSNGERMAPNACRHGFETARICPTCTPAKPLVDRVVESTERLVNGVAQRLWK